MIADLKFGPHYRVNNMWHAVDVIDTEQYYCFIATPAPGNNTRSSSGMGPYDLRVFNKITGYSVEIHLGLDELVAECILIEMIKKYGPGPRPRS